MPTSKSRELGFVRATEPGMIGKLRGPNDLNAGGEWFQSVNHAHEDCTNRRGSFSLPISIDESRETGFTGTPRHNQRLKMGATHML